MKCKYLLIFFTFLLFSCETNISNKKIKYSNKSEVIFVNKGFALIYDDDLIEKKLINKKMKSEDLIIFQHKLKKNTKVLVTNIKNQKSVIAIVGLKSKYPHFYNSVISPRISNMLDLDLNDPYVEIKKINYSNSFIASTTKTFEEEKNVATKVPVEKIKIKDLSLIKVTDNETKKLTFNYSIFIADFYFKESANGMVSRIKENTNIQNIKVKKIAVNQYRVNIGPFKNLNSLKSSFNELKILNFENIEIIKNWYVY